DRKRERVSPYARQQTAKEVCRSKAALLLFLRGEQQRTTRLFHQCVSVPARGCFSPVHALAGGIPAVLALAEDLRCVFQNA
ncbi:hypothetical protein IRJ41_016764, partial [Triplophysa rosa]